MLSAASASTTRRPSRLTRSVVAVARARTAGCASRASIVSRPWIVLSAPLLRLIRAVDLEPVERHPGRRVVHRLARAVGAEEPGRLHPGEVEPEPRAAGVGDREQRLHPGVDAVRDLHAVGGRGLPAVVGAVAGQQRRVEARPPPSSPAAAANGRRAPRSCAPAPPTAASSRRATVERDCVQGSTAPYGQASGSRRHLLDAPRRACAARRGRGRRSRAPTYALSPRTASALASAPSTISQAGTLTPSAVSYFAVALQHVAVQRPTESRIRSRRNAANSGSSRSNAA